MASEWMSNSRLLAQDENPDDAQKAPAKQAAAPPQAAPNQAKNPAANAQSEEKKPESFLSWTFRSLGWRYTIAFLGISFAFVALLIMNILMSRRETFTPPQLVEQFEQCLNEKKFQEAYDVAKGDESFLGQMLAAGLAKLSAGYDHAVEAMQEVGEEENMKAEHRLSYIALIGTIAPMVGLLGTVDGMIASFAVIARNESTPKPRELADGIATALVTTLVGLLIAIPAIAVFNILKNRVSRLVLESGIIGGNLMSRFDPSLAKRV